MDKRKLRPLRTELLAVWSDVCNAMKEFRALPLHILVQDEVLELDLSNFKRQLKIKPETHDDHQVIIVMSNDLLFRENEAKEGATTRQNG